MIDLKELSELLIRRGKVRGNPVGISLFRDEIPDDYEPIQETPCAIVRFAMDEGKKVYFDAGHNDCLVGLHHSGIVPGKKEIVSGQYLSETSEFFTYEGAARLKSGSPVLPEGLVKAIGAAPLDQIDENVGVDWIVVVCNPYNAGFISGGRLAQEGVAPHASFGPSLCGDIFAMPWHERNIIVTNGDFGGRMNNRMKQDQLFVVIPIQFAHYIPVTLTMGGMNVTESRKMTKPAHSKFWEKLKDKEKEKGKEGSKKSEKPEKKAEVKKSEEPKKKAETKKKTAEPEPEPEVDIDAIDFNYAWNDEAKNLLKKVPIELIEMIVGNSEEYAREKNYKEVSRESMEEHMKSMGMDLDEMLDSVS
ncbi:DUF169 domain-containing protein [Spirochaetota bacterium]